MSNHLNNACTGCMEKNCQNHGSPQKIYADGMPACKVLEKPPVAQQGTTLYRRDDSRFNGSGHRVLAY